MHQSKYFIPLISYSFLPLFLINFEKVFVFSNVSFLVPPYKHTHLDIDLNNRSDRIEWGHLRYQSIYKVDHSYELIVQWVASSGSIVADLVSTMSLDMLLLNKILMLRLGFCFGKIFVWQRKAQMCGIQMVPIPSDPLALPYTLKSDPLRGPIFIPLNIESLLMNKRNLFEGQSSVLY